MSESAERTPLSELLAGFTATESGHRVQIPADWLQGRAVYGGLSAALALYSAHGALDALPPLRSVQLTFIGPAGSDVELRPVLDRRGKSTAFVSVDIVSGGRLAVRAALCFGAARDSRLAAGGPLAPAVSGPETSDPFFRRGVDGRHLGPNFAQHFNSRHAAGGLPMSGADAADFTVWLQHKDTAMADSLVGLVALADALPPAAMASFVEPAPISTMTWMFDLLTGDPRTDDGWWLCRSTADATRDGYSSQAMTIWNRAGEPGVAGRQNVAIFY